MDGFVSWLVGWMVGYWVPRWKLLLMLLGGQFSARHFINYADGGGVNFNEISIS